MIYLQNLMMMPSSTH